MFNNTSNLLLFESSLKFKTHIQAHKMSRASVSNSSLIFCNNKRGKHKLRQHNIGIEGVGAVFNLTQKRKNIGNKYLMKYLQKGLVLCYLTCPILLL